MPEILVNARFFALYRDLVGHDEAELRLPHGATAAAAVHALRARGGGYERLPAQPAVAVNQAFASLDVALADGDELALLPPLAGG